MSTKTATLKQMSDLNPGNLSEGELLLLEKEVERLTGRSNRVYWFGKRLFDIVASLLALLFLLPFFLVLSLIIVCDDPHGGPIFRQTRVGRHGKTFVMWKFRSMVVDAEERLQTIQELNEANGPVFKMKNDPRITRVGQWIRRYCIDELPQLLNILAGDMSFVGPRPALPKEVAQYTRGQRLRLAPTPGLTCLWQISGTRHNMPFDEWVALDMEYILNRSWGYDLRLILRTIRDVFF